MVVALEVVVVQVKIEERSAEDNIASVSDGAAD